MHPLEDVLGYRFEKPALLERALKGQDLMVFQKEFEGKGK